MSGTVTIHGSLDTSNQAWVYSVSAFGAAALWLAALGKVRRRANWPIGALVSSGAGTLVKLRRVYSIVTSG